MLLAAEVAMKEGSKLLGRQEYAKRVALDLYRYMVVRRQRVLMQTVALHQFWLGLT